MKMDKYFGEQYAPDIITDIHRRIHAYGDEAIGMSYNNGLVSAMTARELTDAVRWAISNPWHSGIQDFFGSYSPICAAPGDDDHTGRFFDLTPIGYSSRGPLLQRHPL